MITREKLFIRLPKKKPPVKRGTDDTRYSTRRFRTDIVGRPRYPFQLCGNRDDFCVLSHHLLSCCSKGFPVIMIAIYILPVCARHCVADNHTIRERQFSQMPRACCMVRSQCLRYQGLLPLQARTTLQ